MDTMVNTLSQKDQISTFRLRAGSNSRQSSTPSTGGFKAKQQAKKNSRAGDANPVRDTSPLSYRANRNGNQKRVWKACERCRVKKTKCDGELPCNRCQAKGFICMAGKWTKVEFRNPPKGYAEVLEQTHFALIDTILKLYSMLRNGEQWTLGEPEINKHGLPVIHDIASKLNALHLHSDFDLPKGTVFPENEASLLELARQLGAQALSKDQSPLSVTSEDAEPMIPHPVTMEPWDLGLDYIDYQTPNVNNINDNFPTNSVPVPIRSPNLQFELGGPNAFNLWDTDRASSTFDLV